MPHQPYFVVVLAHSLHGRLRRIHVPHKAVYAAFIFAVLGCLFVFGFLSSYLRMTMKVAHYNTLRQEVNSLRASLRETGQCIPIVIWKSQIVDGSPNERTQATEIWTFLRAPGGRWILSAIQQVR